MPKAAYDLARDDLAALVDYHQHASPAARRQKLGCVAAGFCGLMVLPGGILLTTDEPVLETATAIWPLLLGPVLFPIFALPYIQWQTRQMTHRLLREGQNKQFYGHCELEAGTDALTEVRPSGSTVRNWASVERIVVTPSHMFIYTSGIEAYIVPRRAFSTEVEFQAFVNTVAERSGIPARSVG